MWLARRFTLNLVALCAYFLAARCLNHFKVIEQQYQQFELPVEFGLSGSPLPRGCPL